MQPIDLINNLLTIFNRTNKHNSLYQQTVIKLFNRASQTRLLYQNRGVSSLEVFEQFSIAMGKPYKDFKCIHVGGTNGKGSVSTKLANALTQIGFTVGLYTSPHISCVRERIQINGENISEYDFAHALHYVYTLETQSNVVLTYFELLNATAFHHFQQKCVDFAVIEVGVGGTYDSTNVIENPLLSIIVSISLDHTRLLGNTVEQIAKDKCGIIKKGRPIIIGPTVPVSIAEQCAKDKEGILFKSSESVKELTYDEQNTELCKLSLKILSEFDTLPCKYSDMYGFLLIKPKCRFEVRSINGIECIMDVAHNKAGFFAFFKLLQAKYPSNQYLYRFVVGISKHKECTVEIIKATVAVCDYLHLCQTKVKGKRVEGKSTKELCEIITNNTDFDTEGRLSFTAEGNVSDAVLNGLSQCRKYTDGNGDKYEKEREQILCIIGSFYIMAEARKCLMLNDDTDNDFL